MIPAASSRTGAVPGTRTNREERQGREGYFLRCRRAARSRDATSGTRSGPSRDAAIARFIDSREDADVMMDVFKTHREFCYCGRYGK